MIINRFLTLFFVACCFHVSSYAQFTLVKDFDGGSSSSFGSGYRGIVYSLGSKMLVQYDSINTDLSTNLTALASVDAAGNSQLIASATSIGSSSVEVEFYDFKTLPDGKVAFIVIESQTSCKVLITDGTKAGTTTVYSSSRYIYGLELIDNGLYFTCDGSPNQTFMKMELATLAVSEVIEFGYYRNISDISKVSNTSLVFMAPDATDDHILKLYVSDGTSAGTTALAVINTGSEVSQNTVMTQVGNKVYFFYKLPGSDCCNDLWVTDGTAAGTKKLKEFDIVYFKNFVREKKALAFNDKFYFSAAQTGGGADEQLWVSDGTPAGTIALTEADDTFISPRELLVFENAVYFLVFNGTVYNNRLYKTDGTVAGTSLVDLKHASHRLSVNAIGVGADYIYMSAGGVNTNFGPALFRFDGSNTDVEILKDANAGDIITNLYVHEDNLYFTTYYSETGEELYTTGGDFSAAVSTGTRGGAATAACVVYPNPAKDVVTVSSAEKIVGLRLINQAGGLLFETTETSFNTGTYPTGVYYVEVLFSNQTNSYQKLVLNR